MFFLDFADSVCRKNLEAEDLTISLSHVNSLALEMLLCHLGKNIFTKEKKEQMNWFQREIL